jgi:hypothetical protein
LVIPYYSARDLASPREIGGAEATSRAAEVISRGELTADTLEKAGDLRTYDAGLRANPNIRVIVNQNDFLLTDEDLAWLQATFTAEQLTVFNRGGHLGNLSNPTVQKAILAALTPMRPPDPKPEEPPKIPDP